MKQDFTIMEEDFVHLPEILKRIRYCLRNNVGFSLVRVGDAENQVMAQGTIYDLEEINQIWWRHNQNWTGITLPNYAARDRLIESLKSADLVGVLHQDQEFIWRPLTEKVLTVYDIKPRQICYAFINIYLAGNPELVELMKTHRVILVGKGARELATHLQQEYGMQISGTVSIKHYRELRLTLERIDRMDYDLALIAAGSNAVILSVMLAERGKVAIDIGRGIEPERWKS